MNQLLQKVMRSSPKKGRRAAAAAAAPTPVSYPGKEEPGILAELGIETHQDVQRDDSGAPPKPPRRKTGGWGDSNAKSATGRRTALSERGDDQDYSDGETNDGKDMNTIPDLDDFQEEDNASQVAKAPSVAVNRVVTYKELDGDLLKQSTFTSLDDINVKALSKFLSPESEIQEDQTLWTWDILLADVSSKLNVETNYPQDAEK